MAYFCTVEIFQISVSMFRMLTN